MTLAILVNGNLFQRAKGIAVERSLSNYVGHFSVTCSADPDSLIPIKKGQVVDIVSLDLVPFIKGYVERISVVQDSEGHEVTFSGRDITCDLVDSSLRVKKYKGPISFPSLVEKVISDQGLSFSVINQATGLDKIGENEPINGDIGDGAFAFLDTYARRVQAVLTTDETGNILIMRSGKETSSFQIMRTNEPGLNNIIASEMEISDEQRFNEYRCVAQLSSDGDLFTATPTDAASQFGVSADAAIRPGRFKEFEAETAMDAAACLNRADLENNVAAARGFSYSALVPGLHPSVKINRLVRVKDDLCGVDDLLLINGVAVSFDLNGGTQTRIDCVARNSYSLESSVLSERSGKSENAKEFSLL